MSPETITADELDNQPDAQETASDPKAGLATVNEVHLIGRVSAAAVDRDLPSGDVLTTFRVVVYRPEATSDRSKARTRFDALDCHTWSARVSRSAHGWNVDDVVELRGALRRRFYRSTGRLQSMTEVEVFSGKLVRRRAAG